MGLGPVVELAGPRRQLGRQPLQPGPVDLEDPGVGRWPARRPRGPGAATSAATRSNLARSASNARPMEPRPLVDLGGLGGQLGGHLLRPDPLLLERPGDVSPPARRSRRPAAASRWPSLQPDPLLLERPGGGGRRDISNSAATAPGGAGEGAGGRFGGDRGRLGHPGTGAGTGPGGPAGDAETASGRQGRGGLLDGGIDRAGSMSTASNQRVAGGVGRAAAPIRPRSLAGAAPMDDGMRRTGFRQPLRRGRPLVSVPAPPAQTSGQPEYLPLHTTPHPGQVQDDSPARIEWSQPALMITPNSVHRPTSHGTAPSSATWAGGGRSAPGSTLLPGQFAVSGACPVDCALFHKGMAVGLQAASRVSRVSCTGASATVCRGRSNSR